MRTPIAVFAGTQIVGSYVTKAYCAYGVNEVTDWDTADICTLTPTDIHADADELTAPTANCASSATEIVALIGGRIEIEQGSYLTPESRFTRIYRSTDGGVNWTYITQLGGQGDVYIPSGGSHQWWVRSRRCISVSYSDHENAYYALVTAIDKTYADANETISLLVYKSTDGGLTWPSHPRLYGPAYPSIFGPSVLLDEQGRFLAIDSDGKIHVCINCASGVEYWRSQDEGATWDSVRQISPTGAGNSGNCIVALEGTIVVAVNSTDEFLVSLDNGTTWNIYALPALSMGSCQLVRDTNLAMWDIRSSAVEKWLSANYNVGAPTWTLVHSAAFVPYSVSRSRTDALGTQDYIAGQVISDAGSLKGLLWDTGVPNTVRFWTVATGLTLYDYALDFTGYWKSRVGGSYTYFF